MYFDLRGELSFINVTLNVSDCDVTSTTRNTNKNASSAEKSAKEESESLLLQRNVTRILCKFNWTTTTTASIKNAVAAATTFLLLLLLLLLSLLREFSLR